MCCGLDRQKRGMASCPQRYAHFLSAKGDSGKNAMGMRVLVHTFTSRNLGGGGGGGGGGIK